MKNSRKSHYTDVVRTFKSNEQTVCHLLMSFIYVSYLLSVPPVPTTNQKWGARAPLCPMALAPMLRRNDNNQESVESLLQKEESFRWESR